MSEPKREPETLAELHEQTEARVAEMRQQAERVKPSEEAIKAVEYRMRTLRSHGWAVTQALEEAYAIDFPAHQQAMQAAQEALKAQQELLGCVNEENPWLGVTAGLALRINKLKASEQRAQGLEAQLKLMEGSREHYKERADRLQAEVERLQGEIQAIIAPQDVGGGLRALLVAKDSELDRQRTAMDGLRAEVREWLCVKCNTVYPGPPQQGAACVQCPKCGGDCGPRTMMEIRQARAAMDGTREALADLITHYAVEGQKERSYTLEIALEKSPRSPSASQRLKEKP